MCQKRPHLLLLSLSCHRDLHLLLFPVGPLTRLFSSASPIDVLCHWWWRWNHSQPVRARSSRSQRTVAASAYTKIAALAEGPASSQPSHRHQSRALKSNRVVVEHFSERWERTPEVQRVTEIHFLSVNKTCSSLTISKVAGSVSCFKWGRSHFPSLYRTETKSHHQLLVTGLWRYCARYQLPVVADWPGNGFPISSWTRGGTIAAMISETVSLQGCTICRAVRHPAIVEK